MNTPKQALPPELERWAKRMRWLHAVSRFSWTGIIAAIVLSVCGFPVASVIVSIAVIAIVVMEVFSFSFLAFLIRRHFRQLAGLCPFLRERDRLAVDSCA